MSQPVAENRIVRFLFIVGSVFTFLLYGLIKNQIINYSYYKEKEAYQNQRRVVIPAPRGNIYDRNGKVLVENQPIFSIQIDFNDIRADIRREYQSLLQKNRQEKTKIPRNVLQQQARYNVICQLLNSLNKITGRRATISQREVSRHYNEKILLPLTLMSNLSLKEYAQVIDQLPIDSPLVIATNYYRHYPYNQSACHVLGYVVSAMEEDMKAALSLRTFQHIGKLGKTGIELQFNDILAGKNGEEIYEIDPSGFRADLVNSTPPIKGKDLYLSLDIELQKVAEQAICNKKGSVSVIDINTGEILVMLSKPDYDVNLLSPKITRDVYEQITQSEAWMNRNIQCVYPPGSTFKILSAISFVKNNVSTFSKFDVLNCTGKTKIGSRIFKCNQSTIHDATNLTQALIKSCNVYFVERSQQCGINNIYSECVNFGLNHKTGIELPYETSRFVIPNEAWKISKGLGKWFPGDTANVSIGQGFLLVTPLQMTCFIASVAARRYTTIPHILAGNYHQPCTDIGLTNNQYRSLVDALERVVTEGSGKNAKLKKYSLAAKSGTAQVWENRHRKNVAWFVGFAPSNDPKVAICVTVQEESAEDNFYGGKNAAPIAKKVLDFYFEER